MDSLLVTYATRRPALGSRNRVISAGMVNRRSHHSAGFTSVAGDRRAHTNPSEGTCEPFVGHTRTDLQRITCTSCLATLVRLGEADCRADPPRRYDEE